VVATLETGEIEGDLKERGRPSGEKKRFHWTTRRKEENDGEHLAYRRSAPGRPNCTQSVETKFKKKKEKSAAKR